MRLKFLGRYISINRYIQDIEVNKAKNLYLPSLRGAWLPSVDWQINNSGVAVNWLSLRVKLIWKRYDCKI